MGISLILDYKGDLTQKALTEQGSQAISVDFSTKNINFQVDALENQTHAEQYFIAEFFKNLSIKIYDPQDTGIIGPSFERDWENSLYAAMNMERGTLFHASYFVSYDEWDNNYIKEVLPTIFDSLARKYISTTLESNKNEKFFVNRTLNYIGHKIKNLLADPVLDFVFNQKGETFDFGKIMNEKSVLLLDLSKYKESNKEGAIILGSVILMRVYISVQRLIRKNGVMSVPAFSVQTNGRDYLEPELLESISNEKKGQKNWPMDLVIL